MDKTQQENLAFPLCNIQSAYIVGEQVGLPLSTAAQFYREIEFEAFERETIQQALHKLINRHPMLRAIVGDDGTQHILNNVEPYDLIFHDVSDLDPASRNDKYEAIRHNMMSKNLPPAKWPQFIIQASSDGTHLRLHTRFNLWMIDATSVQILSAELLKLCHFPSLELPLLPATFRQFVESTQLAQNSLPITRARDYWYQRATTLPLGPTLPLRCALDEVGKPTFVHLVHVLPAATWANFASIAKQNRLTSNSAILAAYATVLARWSKHRHFTITLLVSRRNVSDDNMADVVGNFGSTILLEINANANYTFSQFATKIQKQLWSDIRNMDISGIEVGQEINRINSTPLGLIAPVTYTSIQSSSDSGSTDLQALKKISQIYSHLDVPQVFIDHQLVEEPQGHVTLNWDFVDGLLQDNVVKDMFESYNAFLELLAADAGIWEQPIKLPLPFSHQKILTTYNRTESAIRDCTLDALVTEQINTHPDSIAIVNGDHQITYAELGARAEEVRRNLSGVAVTPGQLVGVGLPKGWEQVVAVLGILQAGAVYVPIDPELPLLRRKQLIDQAKIDVVITSEALAAHWDCTKVSLVCIELVSQSGSVSLKEPTHLPTDVAYVIFTSGSTGVPKGVVIDHRGAVNTLLDVNKRLGTAATDKVLALSSLSFDLSVFDIFGILAAGGTIIIPTAEEQQSPEAWKQLITKNHISIWNSVPALFQLLVESCMQDKLTLPSLRQVMMSGDWIPRMLPDQGKQIAPGAAVLSLGGATEASIWSVIHETGPLDTSWRTIPYGRPIANQQLYVLDEQLEVCPIWKTGELYIGGRGVALSYLYDSVRTNERFIIHPETGQRLYRTGDMARMRPDGNMEFLGREDHQIKVRGFRIELGEIESFILQQPQVQAAIVKVVGTDNATKRLVAFVVLKPGETLSPKALNDALQMLLPRYMVPEAIHLLPVLPLTNNGKIDHVRLEDLCAASQVRQNVSEPMIEDDLAATLLQVWREILSEQEIDPDASFFSLGGTSFQVLQLIAKIRKEFEIKLGFADIASDLSLRKMITLLRERGQQSDHGTLTLLNLREAHQSDPAIFCIHPVGGSAHCYIPLANRIAPGARIFGVPAPHAAPGSKASIEKLAAQYADLIIQAAQDSQILLVGWSMGAAIVCEIGRFLRDKNRQVKFIGLLDPYCRVQSDVPISSTEILLAFCNDLAGLANRHFDRSIHNFEQVLDKAKDEQKFALLMEEMQRQSILPLAAPLEELLEIYSIFERNTRALLAYNPTFIDEEVTVFHAEKDVYRDGRYLKKWQLHARKLNEYKCNADHFTIMQEPAISMIAETVNRYLTN